MLVKKKCRVCGKDFVGPNRKDSKFVCSQNCYEKLRRREDLGLPISNEEFKKDAEKRRKKAYDKKKEQPRSLPYIRIDDIDRVCLCKRTDCMYMANQNLHTCDYILMTGHMRGCPVEGCTKYAPWKVRRNNLPKL
jgi:predicted NUDIX family phosphoesterase